MRLVNYNYSYIPLFGCSIHGKIVMTQGEWWTAKRYLLNPSVLKSLARGQFTVAGVYNRLGEDMVRRQFIGKAVRFNVRVPATEKLVKRFGLVGYKRANYMIEVK